MRQEGWLYTPGHGMRSWLQTWIDKGARYSAWRFRSTLRSVVRKVLESLVALRGIEPLFKP